MEDQQNTFGNEPVVQEQQELFPEYTIGTVPGNLDELATQVAVVTTAHDGTPLESNVATSANSISTLGIEETRRSIADKERALSLQVAETAVRNAPNEDTAAYYAEVIRKHTGGRNIHALEQATVDTITPPSSVEFFSEFVRKENAKDLAARNIIYETLLKGPGEGWYKNPGSKPFWDTILSVGREFAGFLNPRSLGTAAAEALGRKATFGEVFNPDQVINEFRMAYATAAPEKKKQMVDALVHGLQRTSSLVGDKNDVQVAINMERILSQTSQEADVTAMVDVAGLPLVTVASALTRAAKAAKEFGKPANVAIRAGNPELATHMMASDAIKKTAVSGMTPEEIAKQATAMNMTPTELSMTNLKVSQQLQDKLAEYGSTVRQDLKNTLMPSNVDPIQVGRGAEYYENLYSTVRNKAVYEYRPTAYDNGLFTGTVKWQAPEGLPFASREAAEQFGLTSGKIGQAERVNFPNFSILAEHYPGVDKSMPDVSKIDYSKAEQVGKRRVYSKKEGSFAETPEINDPFIYTLKSAVKKDKQGRYYYDETTYEVPSDWVFVEKISNPLPVESIGTVAKADVEGRNFWNFKIPMLAASIDTVRQSALAVSANARIRNVLQKAYKDSIKGLSGKEQGAVHKALVDGDALSNAAGAEGKVFDAVELAAKGLSDKAIESYYRLRILRDAMWLERNKQMTFELKSMGMKELAFNGSDHVPPLHTPAKPMDTATLKSMNTQGKIGKVLHVESGKTEALTSERIDEIYEGGYQVFRLYKPQVINGRRHSYIVADNRLVQLREISTPVPYRPGEFARSYTDEYFITTQRNIPDEFDRKFGDPGYEASPTNTVRTARNSAEAKMYADRHNEAIRILFSDLTDADKLRLLEKEVGQWTSPKELMEAAKRGELTADTKYDFHYNREKHTYLQDTIDESMMSGRLFTSQRNGKLLSVDASRQNTLDVYESLGVELANIARYVTSKDIRVDAIERWMNSFGHGLVNPSHNKMADFIHQPLDASKIKEGLLEMGSDLADLNSADLLKFAESERDYIKAQLNIRTQAQKTNAETYRRATEMIEGTVRGVGLDKAADWLGPNMRQANVPDFLRKANFVITLAAGNVAQLVVQANGMMIAAARHPIHGLGAAKTAIPLRIALMSDNPDVWKTMATIDSLSSLGLKNINEFVDIVAAVKKSGILDDIRSTALYNVNEGALDLFKGYSREFLSGANTFFFDRGEEFSRLVAWEVARREWKKANPGKAWNSDNALREISIKQKEYNLGMQSHNTAFWQTGWTGIPMQFLQYNVKLMAGFMHSMTQLGKDLNKSGWKAFTNFDNGNYRQFNPAEALSVLGTQLVVYGVAGNGLYSMANELWGNESDLTTEQKMYISEGLAGGLIYSLTKELDEYGKEEGAKLALGTRLGSFNWYSQIFDKITGDKSTTSDFLLGATKSNGVKVFDTARNLARLFYYSDEVTPELVMDEFSKIPEIFSSWNNALKAYTYMQNEGIVTSKDGTPIARINSKENLAAYIGISSVQVQEYYKDVQDQTKLYSDLTDLAKEIYKLQIRQWDAVSKGDQKLADSLERMRWALMPRDLAHRRFVDSQLKTKIWPGDTASDRIRREFVEQMNQDVERFRVMDKGQK